jgi:hypothetical protein
MCDPVEGKDVYGDVLKEVLADDMDARGCEWMCGEDSECGCWTFDPNKDNGCWLKKTNCGGFTDGQQGIVSGECSTCPECSPTTRTKPTVVVPFYHRDLCKMRILASSISKHDPMGYLGDVALLWLDKDTPGTHQEDVDDIIGSIQSTHSVTLHDFSWVFGTDMKGWEIQQVMKLKAAMLVNSDFFVVLDAKNAFIRDVKFDTFISECNTGLIYAQFTVEEQGGEKKEWFEKSAKALGLGVPEGKVGGSITPVIFHTQTVKDLLEHELGEELTVEKFCTSGKLCDAIRDGATEFTLYYTFVKDKTAESCIHNSIDSHPALSLWNGVDVDSRLNAARAAAEDDNIIMFGMQPGACDNLGDKTDDIWGAVEKVYSQAGLHDASSNSRESLIVCVAHDFS